MADGTELPVKKDVALALLEGPSMLVHLDPRRDGVVVPKWFKKQTNLVLQIGMNLAVPIPDLVVSEAGICCTLSFNRSPFLCDVPWSAIYALVGEDRRGMIWPEDVPPELAQKKPQPALAVVSDKKPRKKTKPAAAVVEVAAEVAAEAEAADAEAVGDDEAERAPLVAVARAQADPSDDPASAPQADEGQGAERKLPSYLRVVK